MTAQAPPNDHPLSDTRAHRAHTHTHTHVIGNERQVDQVLGAFLDQGRSAFGSFAARVDEWQSTDFLSFFSMKRSTVVASLAATLAAPAPRPAHAGLTAGSPGTLHQTAVPDVIDLSSSPTPDVAADVTRQQRQQVRGQQQQIEELRDELVRRTVPWFVFCESDAAAALARSNSTAGDAVRKNCGWVPPPPPSPPPPVSPPPPPPPPAPPSSPPEAVATITAIAALSPLATLAAVAAVAAAVAAASPPESPPALPPPPPASPPDKYHLHRRTRPIRRASFPLASPPALMPETAPMSFDSSSLRPPTVPDDMLPKIKKEPSKSTFSRALVALGIPVDDEPA